MRQHPFGEKFHSFERPQWRNFGIHFALCAVAYPTLLIFVILARGRDLFWARVLVGMGCGLTGLTLGFSLLRLSRPIIEAITWATLIHQSRVAKLENGGIRLKDFAAHTDDPTSALGALKLMWDRFQYPGTIRSNRRNYDRRPWSLWILFFLANVGLAGALTFIFGRLVAIQVHIIHQYKNYQEFPVKGDITQGDIDRAVELNKAFENYALTWTLAPFSTHGGLPPVVSFPWASENTAASEPALSPRAPVSSANIPDAKPGNDMVYFAEVITNQLVPGGSGFGTFEDPTASVNGSSALIGGIGSWATETLASGPIVELEPGSVLRFPRWGIRIHCEKLLMFTHSIPRSESNKTYVFIPRDTLGGLFNHFNSSLPAAFEKTANTTTIRGADGVNDTMPADDELQSFASGGKFYDNGVAHSMMSVPLSMGTCPGSIITVETILVRLNTTYAEHGKFALLSNDSIPDVDGNPTHIGYDAAVCLQLYEPWIVEVYNSSVGVPNSIRLCDKGAEIHDMSWNVSPEVMTGVPLKDQPELSRALNSSHLISPYIAGHQNSVNQMLKDNGRDSFYVPSPTLVSYTDGEGAFGYTELSTDYYAKARAIADASNVLPYLAGSGSTVARLYPDKEVSDVYIHNGYYALAISVVFLMGALATFFVPRLPLGSPRRGFDLFSWMTAFAAREIVPDRASGLEKQMELNDIVQHAGEMRFRYVG
ncbi:hypothetical protein CPB83DRAFT_769770 [Crepidotus variabilis]|uniref:Uncharacterized protein n=1 Tax=Crepidotus variabilis TaxID=179855 RepID=A0A9P6EC25_9AGAR|nr:hypothetical protein CPB83DRAFT_769770 [Crepidotus variabilis]